MNNEKIDPYKLGITTAQIKLTKLFPSYLNNVVINAIGGGIKNDDSFVNGALSDGLTTALLYLPSKSIEKNYINYQKNSIGLTPGGIVDKHWYKEPTYKLPIIVDSTLSTITNQIIDSQLNKITEKKLKDIIKRSDNEKTNKNKYK